jgi:hypothetical protein
MANADWATKIKSIPFGNLLNAGNLGATFASGSPASPTPSANFQVPSGVNPDIAFVLQYGKPTPAELDAQSDRELNRSLRLLTEQDKLARSQADYRQKLGEQSTKKALMYSTIAKLPEQMANAFSPYGGQTGALMAYEGMSRIPEIYRSTLASVPQMNISTPGYSSQQPRYLS